MRLYHLSLLVIFAGIALLFYAVAIGEANASLFLIFPVIYGSGVYSLLAILLIMIGMILLFFAPFQSVREAHRAEGRYDEEYGIYEEPRDLSLQDEKKKVNYGGVVFIGPIPIVFGSDKSMARLSVLIAILMLVAFLLFFLYGNFYG